MKKDCFSGFAFSRDCDSSLMSRDGVYASVGNNDWCGILPAENVNKIIGYGSSPLVTYEGGGLYFIDVYEQSVDIEILPHAEFVRNPCEWHTDGGIVSELDFKQNFPLN